MFDKDKRELLFVGALACVFMIVKYDSIKKNELTCVVSVLFDMRMSGISNGNDEDILHKLRDVVSHSKEFNTYYDCVEPYPFLSGKFDANKPQGDMRLLGAIVCLDLLRDLSVLTILNNYNFIVTHFLCYHNYPLEVAVFDCIRQSVPYLAMRRKLSSLLLGRLVDLRKRENLPCTQ